MHNIRLLAIALAASTFVAFSANGATSDIDIGAAAQVVNKVYGTPESTHQSRWWRPGLDVFHNETVVTAESSASRVVFRDDSQLSIGPISLLKLDNFVYNPSQTAGAVSIALVKGVFRFVGGKTSHEQNFKISTPAANIGLRGTAFTVYILENGMEYISVESGEISVTCHRGITRIIRAGEMTYFQSPKGTSALPQKSVPIPAVSEMDSLLH